MLSTEAFIVYGTFVASALAFGVLLGMVVQAYIDARKDVRIIERLEDDVLAMRVALIPFAYCYHEAELYGDRCEDCDGCRAYDAIMREERR